MNYVITTNGIKMYFLSICLINSIENFFDLYLTFSGYKVISLISTKINFYRGSFLNNNTRAFSKWLSLILSSLRFI